MGPRSNKKGKFTNLRLRTRSRSLTRPAPTRTVGKSILIVCEDSKASPDYFNKFRHKLRLNAVNNAVNVEVCGKECGSDPKSVVDYAKLKSDVRNSTIRDSYDEIFCVVDVDNHTTLGDAIQTARDNSIKLIISNPCFEYWYILHFGSPGSAYQNRQKLYKRVGTLLGRKYGKCGCEFFEQIYPLTEDAINNAKAILRSQWHNQEDLSQCNPSTHVHRVVECMINP